MKIFKWLRNSSLGGVAVIEVEPDEIADIGKMLILLDGDSVGHFGIKVELVATDDPPKIKGKKIRGKTQKGVLDTDFQFGYANASTMLKKRRYYRCHVARD